MAYRNRQYNNYRRSKNYGRDRALQHIREGQELSSLLGGTDETVKHYLYGLSKANLEPILIEYGSRHGQVAEEYARETIPKWRSGQVQMSGMVAERLYQLLPPGMPLSIKYKIAEELWHHTGPSSAKAIRFGRDAYHSEIIKSAEDHIVEVVQRYQIPDSLQKRFDWLTTNDVGVKQTLLNHLRELDRKLVIEATTLQSASMLKHLAGENTTYTKSYMHTVSVGKHHLTLVADKDLEGSELKDDIPQNHSINLQEYSWVLWVLVAAVVLALIVWSSSGE